MNRSQEKQTETTRQRIERRDPTSLEPGNAGLNFTGGAFMHLYQFRGSSGVPSFDENNGHSNLELRHLLNVRTQDLKCVFYLFILTNLKQKSNVIL